MSQDFRYSTGGRRWPVAPPRVLLSLLLAGVLGACSLLSDDETAPTTQAAIQGAPAAGEGAAQSGTAAAPEAAAPTADAAPGAPVEDSASAADGTAAEAVIPAAAEAPGPSELGRVSIVYPPDNADLPESVTAELDKLAAQLVENRAVRVELHAYASGDEGRASKAKLYSLKRGMRVRSYLYKAGVEAPRIVLRPLGIETDAEPADRVDIILLRDEQAVPETRVAEGGRFVPAPGSVLTENLASSDDGGARQTAEAPPAEKPLGSLEALGVIRSEPAGTQSAAAPPVEEMAPAPSGGEPASASSEPEATDSAVAGTPLPQGDAGAMAEDSLAERFEAIAAADVQLAEAPEQRATIERRGGTIVGSDDQGNLTSSEAVLAELPPGREPQPGQATGQPSFTPGAPSQGESAFASHFSPQPGAPPGAATEVTPPAMAEPTTAPRLATGPALPSAPAAEVPPGGNAAVSVAEGEAFEAAVSGGGGTTAPPSESAPANAPALAALPPADNPTGTARSAMPAISPDHYLVQFELDSPDMTSDGRSTLQAAIAEVLSRPDVRVRVIAHAEGEQSDEFLVALSAIRRNEVENALRNSGVPFGRIWSKAVGDRKPLVAGVPGAASAENNVVEIVIIQRS